MEKYLNIDEDCGIQSIEPYNLEKGEPTGEVIVYYRTNKKDKGVIFNYCPWCGTDLNKLNELEGK
jgi:hypothetical protein